MFVNEREILVEWGDCDPAGIVFYPNYLAWFDHCTTALFNGAGLPTHALFKAHGIIGVPLVDLKVRFLSSSTFNDKLLARSRVLEWRKTSFLLQHQFYKGGVLAVEGVETRVWTGPDPENPGRLKSRSIPAEVIERLSSSRPVETSSGEDLPNQ
jgi:4-hydroxybenzoyl-CoA thioesterase